MRIPGAKPSDAPNIDPFGPEGRQPIRLTGILNSREELIALGGVTRLVKTYGDLVTSIINPSHRYSIGYAAEEVKTDGESQMRLYNDEMTVTQLIDLVTFLQPHYEVDIYPRTPYVPFY